MNLFREKEMELLTLAEPLISGGPGRVSELYLL